MKPRLLDLFSGAGGAATGYHQAGFDVTGVDLHPQPNYPFTFHQRDALAYLAEHGHEYDAVHASPPCQAYSDLHHRTGRGYPDLLALTRDALIANGRPYVIENVEGAPLHNPLWLCGTEFVLKATTRDGIVRWLRRHRGFETSFFVMGAGGCHCTGKPIGGVYGTGGGGHMTRGYKFHPDEARQAMQITWMTRREIAQAIPPACTHHIGLTLIASLTAVADTSTLASGRP
jgi:DNA (cytosine-5)-methyltransferase 1